MRNGLQSQPARRAQARRDARLEDIRRIAQVKEESMKRQAGLWIDHSETFIALSETTEKKRDD